MAGQLDPNAIYGWCGQGEERRPITYPDPTWYDDPEQAVENDPAAAYCFRRARDHYYFRGVRYAAPPWPDSNPFRRPQVVAAAPPPPASPPPLPSTPPAPPSLLSRHGSVPASASATALLPPQPLQHRQQQHQPQHQQQQQTLTRAPPQWGPPSPGQRIDRYDRFFGCLHCQWTGDRERKAVEHVERAHQRAQGQSDVDWVDWGHIKPRFK